MDRLRIYTGFFILALVTLSCFSSQPIQPKDVPQSDADQIGTIVAQTVEAKSITSTPEQLSPAEKTPTDAPTATLPVPQKLRIAYMDGNRYLWLWEEGGASMPLDQSGEVALARISSDGRLVMFLRTPDWINYSLWVADRDGSGLRELVSQSKFNEILANPGLAGLSPADVQYAVAVAPNQIEWIPGEHSLVYNTSPKFEGPGSLINNDLWKLNADTGEMRLLLKAGEGGNFYFSPDSQQIALVTAEDISFINVDLSNRRTSVLQYTPVITYSEYMFYAEPVWSPDSGSLLVDIPPEDMMKQPPDSHSVYRIPADGGQPTLLASIYPYFLREVYFSPDTTRMAYITQEGAVENDLKALHIANVDGSQDSVYETSNLKFAGWSGDSNHFIITVPDGSNPRIGRIGTSPVALAGISAAQNIRWIDDERFLFTGKNNQDWQLRIGHLDGSSELVANFGPMMDVFWLDASISIAE